jgi:hypothetical protein
MYYSCTFGQLYFNRSGTITYGDYLFDRPVLTRVMLQEAFELLVSRVFESPTDQKVILIASKFRAGS